MNTSFNQYDTIEAIIYNEKIRIQSIDLHPKLDMFLVLLNTGSVLQEQLSHYPKLYKSDKKHLSHYRFIGNGTGIHWPELDEDLSLKGFIRNAVHRQIVPNKVA